MNCLNEDETNDSTCNEPKRELETSRQKLKNLLNKSSRKNVIENPFLANTVPSPTVTENDVIENPFLSTIGPTETHVKKSFISNAAPRRTIENSYSSNTGSSQTFVENPFLSSNEAVENPFLSIVDSKKLVDINNHEKLDKFRSSHDRVKSLLANVNLTPNLENFRYQNNFDESLRGKKNIEESLRKQGTYNVYLKFM